MLGLKALLILWTFILVIKLLTDLGRINSDTTIILQVVARNGVDEQ